MVNPAVPAKTVPEFIAYAKANPRKVNMASDGNGAVQHLAGELFKIMTGVDMAHVPYLGAHPALTDLMSGQVQVTFVTSTVEYIKAGKVRPLAVTTATRWEAMWDIPTLSEFLPGYDVAVWIGVSAPKRQRAMCFAWVDLREASERELDSEWPADWIEELAKISPDIGDSVKETCELIEITRTNSVAIRNDAALRYEVAAFDLGDRNIDH